MKRKRIKIPKDFPVRPLRPSTKCAGRATCGTCGLSWDDDKPTAYTPVPSARCPFEAFHDCQDDAAGNERLVAAASRLLEACKLAARDLRPRGDIKSDFSGHLAIAALQKAIIEAEGKLE